ncbi:MAG: spondin domain-containing protein [Planctomycetota bacterium]
MKTTLIGGMGLIAAVALSGPVAAAQIEVTIENRSKRHGLYMTPVWVALHDGGFDVFDPGVPTTPGGGLERIAEDGNASVLSAEFAASPSGQAGGLDAVILAPAGFPGAPVFDPMESATMVFDVDPESNRFLSFVSMIIPSNDAFIGNHDPTMIELFDANGAFVGPIKLEILGSMVWDAGTEANTEMDAAFFNQFMPYAGQPTMEPVLPHVGFIGSAGHPIGLPIILGGTSIMPPGIFFDEQRADFSRRGYKMARIRVRLIE